ncbi:Mis12-Mtw1 protein family-domain-containing protein [Protomyces lactucae-debilis]|uniref:Mis12-Mtw1 protein family-domain-containing protein n=1 Tax=Protomyces lactucae-debilis TaxID=2754530 RepID=A0A1Y2FTZ8_PROLT|nr:Mis12-Mtw1 protein family-domain-containing protein [Protomyces lactucae-debilis]ORY87037.1 Mis12-Mtw1 protein family-domain-containing protein [Protomyces lactucae-debilis]
MAKSAAASARTTKRSAKDDMSKKAIVVPSKKRKQPQKAESDEDDAGFAFTRPTKVSKTTTTTQATRSSPRNHAKKTGLLDDNKPAGSATPRSSTVASAKKQNNNKSAQKATTSATVFDDLANGSDSFIALPVSDTPIIRKNQALRQGLAVDNSGRRRSSLSMRGKRASSMGNGFNSQPHPDVTPADFYKHIGVEMPDPIRMKQLLGWCARRALEESKTPTSTKQTDSALQIELIARTIEEEVLRDLADGKITTSWYGRPQEEEEARLAGVGPTTRRKLPHPQNVANAKKLAEMEARLAKLKMEEEAWVRLRSSGLATQTEGLPADAALPAAATETGERFAKLPQQDMTHATADIDLDLLTAAEAEFVHAATTRPNRPLAGASKLQDDPREEWLQNAEQTLEFNVDAFRHQLHTRGQFIKDADEQAGKLLAIAAEALVRQEQRERVDQEGKGVGMMDILKAITRTS